MKKTLVVYGTRPEYLKVKTLIGLSDSIDSLFVKQHTDIIDFGVFDHSIQVEDSCRNRLNSIFQQVFLKAEGIISKYDNVVVQGDTATVAAISLVAYHLKKKIFYIEAGLRSFDWENPFPEEGYRQMVSRIATVNLCPTELSAQNLRNEGVLGAVHIVGNTILDTLSEYKCNTGYSNKVLITLHRNENLKILPQWFAALNKIASSHPSLEFLYPVHPNPIIVKEAQKLDKITLLEPLEHDAFLKILKDCCFVISDSGGIQEEGSFLNKRVIVCRKTTERPEAIESGHLILCGAPSDLEKTVEMVVDNFTINARCPYGDGKSSKKISKIISEYE
jgi:UDP-N-acetylglucosamine 2-epimerase (non-hydrolysing)